MNTLLGRTIGRNARKLRRLAFQVVDPKEGLTPEERQAKVHQLCECRDHDSFYLRALNISIQAFNAAGKKPRGAAYDYAVSRGIS